MRWKRIAARMISEVSALKSGKGFLPGFRVMLYHAVGSRLAHDPYGISVEAKLFKEQTKFLSESPAVDVVRFQDGHAGNSSLRVALTFDDGYKDNLYTAAPILLEFNIPFTVFVTSAFIQSGSKEYLTPAELRELASLTGVNIGSHGATHLPLAGCDDQTLRQELSDSRSYIEDVIGREVTSVAYPHGSVNIRVRDAAQDIGYTRGACSRFGINDESRDPLLLCRCEVVAADSERVFLQKVKGAWDWYRWRERDPAHD